MSKRARRLWLGDWQRDGEEEAGRPQSTADQGDTFVILPEDDGAAERRAGQRRNLRRAAAAAAAIAVLSGLVLAVSSGGDDNRLTSARSQTPPAQTPQAQPQLPQSQVPQTPPGTPPPGFGGADLSGRAAEQAAKAAVARFPGDVERVTRGPAGDGYVVHVIQPEGGEVHVAVSDEFKVLGSDAGSVPGFGAQQQGGSANSS